MFVGYDLDSPGFRVLIDEVNDIVSSSNVIFDDKNETESFTELELSLFEKDFEKSREEESDTSSEYVSIETEESETESITSEKEENNQKSENENKSDSSDENQAEMLVKRNLRDRRKIKAPVRFRDYEIDSAFITKTIRSLMTGEVNDVSVAEALEDENWKKAMLKEFMTLTKMKTWTLVVKPKDINPITCRWVFTRKTNGVYKARLVARGFEQKEDIDNFEVFSPVVRHASVRLVLSIASSEGMSLITFDVIAAFLYGNLSKKIYMYQPEGFNDGSGRVCELLKSIYGLNQAPKIWNTKFTNFLKSIGLQSTDDDPCVFYNKDRSIIIVLHVDDGLMAGKNMNEMLEVLEKLKGEFEITYDTGKEKFFSYLGMQIEVSNERIFINQSKYAEKIVERFNFEDVNPVHTPIEKGMVTDTDSFVNDRPLDKSEPYREAIGSLLYLATISRPDICFAVNYLSRFNNKPMTSHWKMVKRVFQYVKGTTEFGIIFNGNKELFVYSDSDYGGDLKTGHSTSGVLLLRGGPVVWFTQKQSIVANSTAEAEYRATISAIDDICWIRRLAAELNQLNVNKPTPHYIDNQSAIHMLNNTHEGKITKGKKHIEISRKFIQQHIGSTILPVHVKSEDQLADIFTKPLLRRNFERLRRKIIKEEC